MCRLPSNDRKFVLEIWINVSKQDLGKALKSKSQ